MLAGGSRIRRGPLLACSLGQVSGYLGWKWDASVRTPASRRSTVVRPSAVDGGSDWATRHSLRSRAKAGAACACWCAAGQRTLSAAQCGAGKSLSEWCSTEDRGPRGSSHVDGLATSEFHIRCPLPHSPLIPTNPPSPTGCFWQCPNANF